MIVALTAATNPVAFLDFLRQLTGNFPLLITVLLTLAVILVNGWTDAPNAIATCISTRAMAPRPAILMAAVFNFFGILVMTMVNTKVTATVYRMVDFGNDSREGLIGLCAAMVAIVVWAVAAWVFGIPTSESHALIAGLSGAAIAMHNSFDGISFAEWSKVLQGLLLSTIAAFIAGWVVVRLLQLIFRRMDRRKTTKFFRGAQISGAAAMAFMHGAQDGQKFMGVFLLGLALSNGTVEANFVTPFWLILLCSVIMGLGTSVGGMRIIKAVGMDMVKLETYQGFAADIAAAGCLLLTSLTGIPVSTTHTKTAAIMGVGAQKRLRSVNWGVAGEMVMTWLLTFPGCGLIGFAMAKLFVAIF